MLQLDQRHDPRQPVPPRALGLSLAALSVPVAGGLMFPDSLRQYAAMLWLLALVPAFLLAYYRGWRGGFDGRERRGCLGHFGFGPNGDRERSGRR